MLELTQEVVSIGVLLAVCVSLSLICLLLWMVRCRRDQLRNREDEQDRQKEIDSLEDHKKIKPTSKSSMKVHEVKKDPPKRAETDNEKEKPRTTGTVARVDETMHQFETRVRLESQDEETKAPAKNKRLDSISATGPGSTNTLQRNDSKVNVFSNGERVVEEMDLNPGLSGSFTLETI